MCSGQRIEIRVDSLKCEIRENLLDAKQGRKAERWTKFQEENHHKYAGVKSRWCVWNHKCTGFGRRPIRSGTVLQEGANFKRHRLERIAQTYKVVTAFDWCYSEGVVGTCRLQEERERVTARKRCCFERINSDMEEWYREQESCSIWAVLYRGSSRHA